MHKRDWVSCPNNLNCSNVVVLFGFLSFDFVFITFMRPKAPSSTTKRTKKKTQQHTTEFIHSQYPRPHCNGIFECERRNELDEHIQSSINAVQLRKKKLFYLKNRCIASTCVNENTFAVRFSFLFFFLSIRICGVRFIVGASDSLVVFFLVLSSFLLRKYFHGLRYAQTAHNHA